jgi:hypothetical protein
MENITAYELSNGEIVKDKEVAEKREKDILFETAIRKLFTSNTNNMDWMIINAVIREADALEEIFKLRK